MGSVCWVPSWVGWGLTRHQVEVVDAPADLFAAKVADAYLAMKAAGRL